MFPCFHGLFKAKVEPCLSFILDNLFFFVLIADQLPVRMGDEAFKEHNWCL